MVQDSRILTEFPNFSSSVFPKYRADDGGAKSRAALMKGGLAQLQTAVRRIGCQFAKSNYHREVIRFPRAGSSARTFYRRL